MVGREKRSGRDLLVYAPQCTPVTQIFLSSMRLAGILMSTLEFQRPIEIRARITRVNQTHFLYATRSEADYNHSRLPCNTLQRGDDHPLKHAHVCSQRERPMHHLAATTLATHNRVINHINPFPARNLHDLLLQISQSHHH